MKAKEQSKQVRDNILERFKARYDNKERVEVSRHDCPPKLTGHTSRALIGGPAKKQKRTLEELQRSKARLRESFYKTSLGCRVHSLAFFYGSATIHVKSDIL